MPNKTAYMQAYEAGVKLATYNYIEKVAKPLNVKQEQAPSATEVTEPTREGPNFYGDLATSIGRGIDTAGDYLSTAGTNLFNSASDAVGSIADVFNSTNSGAEGGGSLPTSTPQFSSIARDNAKEYVTPTRNVSRGGSLLEKLPVAPRTQQPQQAPQRPPRPRP